MNVFNIFNKASQTITDYFSFIGNKIQNPQKEIQDSLIQINPKIFIWIKDTNFKDDQFIQVIRSNFKDNYMIYNLLSEKIETETSPDKIIDFKLPNNPSFSLESLISFCISSKNWLNANEENILVIHDDLTKNDGNIFYLISTIIAYNNNNNIKNKNEIKEPVDIYKNLLSAFENHQFFQNLPLNNNSKNNTRYLNYFSSIQKSPLITLKKMQLNNIIISGAPAIDNDENKSNTHYITINKNSYYIPVIRIKSNGKFIYSSYNPKDPENKNKLNKIFYSNDNIAKFDINQMCFNDVCIEVMHKGEKSFRLLFTIQFNTFFINSNYSIKFSKEQIDSIYQDIRYPNDFYVDLIFDSSKEEKLSPFDDYSIIWKTMLSEFIVKGLSKSNKNEKKIENNEKNINNKENKENKDNKDKNINNDNNNKIENNLNDNINNNNEKKDKDNENKINEENNISEINNKNEKDIIDNKKENNENENENKKYEEHKDINDDKDDDILNTMGNTNNTLNQVNDLLKQIEGEGGDNNDKEEQEEDEEDIENYLKNLENK
jgi:hypothetical protein